MNSCCAQGVIGCGPTNTGVVVVGIAPGRDEVVAGRPFVGPSGRMLDNILSAVAWPREQVFTTNLICSFNNEPAVDQVSACAPRLRDELHRCALGAPGNKLLIITLGKIATETLLKLPFGKARGAVLNVTDTILGTVHAPDVTVAGLATFHPSGILQSDDKPEDQTNMATTLVRDLQKIGLYMNNVSHPYGLAPVHSGHIAYTNPAPFNFELVTSRDRAQEILNSIDTSYKVVIDLETDYDKDAENGDPYGPVTCIGIRYTLNALPSRSGMDRDRCISVFTQDALVELEWPQASYCGHNLYGFDAVTMRDKFGVPISINHDTFLASYAWDDRTNRTVNKGLHKLKPRSREYCGAGFYEDENEHKPGMALYTYNANDVFYTDIFDDFLESQFDDDERKLYYDLLLPAAAMYSEAQYYGVKIDHVRLAQLGAQWLGEKYKLESELQQEALAKGFRSTVKTDYGVMNLNSSHQIKRYLNDYCGYKLESTNKNVLADLNNDWCTRLLKTRRLDKTYREWIDRTIRQVKYDGRLHPKCILPGTKTGRPVFTTPPVNTLPHARSVGELSQARSIFIPDSEDYILMEFDYAQIELYILQWLSQDQNLLADLYEPWHVTGEPDYHSRSCELIVGGRVCSNHGVHTVSGCVDCVKWKFDRDNQKHVNFGIAYGETAHGLTRPAPIGTGQDLKTCQRYIDEWYARYQDVWRWQKQIQAEIYNNGEVVTPFGRKCRMPVVNNSKQLRQIINFPVQSIASDYTLTSALELWPLLRKYDSRMLWTTYDSILLNVNRVYADDVRDLVRHVMTKPRVPGGPSVAVDMSQGENLYEVSEVH